MNESIRCLLLCAVLQLTKYKYGMVWYEVTEVGTVVTARC